MAVSGAEDPEKILDQAVNELQSDLIKMRQASAQASILTAFCKEGFVKKAFCKEGSKQIRLYNHLFAGRYWLLRSRLRPSMSLLPILRYSPLTQSCLAFPFLLFYSLIPCAVH